MRKALAAASLLGYCSLVNAMVAGFGLLWFACAPAGATVYGKDNRLDVHQVYDLRLVDLSRSVAALYPRDWVRLGAVGPDADLFTRSYAEAYNLCPSEAFYDQPIGASCSGALVGPDIVLTAGHCVPDERRCRDQRVVFGFEEREEGQNPTLVAKRDVYECVSIIARVNDVADMRNLGPDWALIRLDRPVTGRVPLPVRSSGDAVKGTPLVAMGHPSGLPLKVSRAGRVRADDRSGFLIANLDILQGNSGSPVFNADTGEIEGVVSRGEVPDYETRLEVSTRIVNGRPQEIRRQCNVSKRCAESQCRGAEVTRASEFLAELLGASVSPPAPSKTPVASDLLRSLGELDPFRESP